MKIEKISDTQIKFILSRSDLEERNIKIEELTVPSDKTQNLFRDIMEQAMEEYDFISHNSPLMVEAVPSSTDGIMIIVTKLEDLDSEENNLKLLSQSKDVRRFKRKSINFLDIEKNDDDCISIFSFKTLDDVIDLSVRLSDIYYSSNALYKENNRYFLVLSYDNPSDKVDIDDIELILCEYGQKHISTKLSKAYLMEHGELIVKSPAMRTLAKSFS